MGLWSVERVYQYARSDGWCVEGEQLSVFTWLDGSGTRWNCWRTEEGGLCDARLPTERTNYPVGAAPQVSPARVVQRGSQLAAWHGLTLELVPGFRLSRRNADDNLAAPVGTADLVSTSLLSCMLGRTGRSALKRWDAGFPVSFARRRPSSIVCDLGRTTEVKSVHCMAGRCRLVRPSPAFSSTGWSSSS